MDAKKNEDPLIWKLNVPGLIAEIGGCCRDATALRIPLQCLMNMLGELAQYAIKLDDPELNIMMLKMSLFDVPCSQVDEEIKKQRKRIKNKNKRDNKNDRQD